MRVGDIQKELTKVGKLKGGHGDYGTLFGSLSRDYRFTKAGLGIVVSGRLVYDGLGELIHVAWAFAWAVMHARCHSA
jgi:hypothetical protein